jgi:maltose O-acetyltransferase
MEYEERDLPARRWTEIRSPVRMVFNGIVCEVCKYLPSARLKNMLYRMIGVDVGEGVVIAPHVQIDPIMPEKISIGDGAVIGWGAEILTHEFVDGTFRTGKVEIGEGCTIGVRSVVRSGVTIGDGAIVGMHSFVNRDVEAGDIVGGVPEHSLETDE